MHLARSCPLVDGEVDVLRSRHVHARDHQGGVVGVVDGERLPGFGVDILFVPFLVTWGALGDRTLGRGERTSLLMKSLVW